MALVDRVKNILVAPQTEWPIIAAEPATVQSLYSGYIIPLAAIPAIASFVGRIFFFHSLVGNVVFAILTFVLSLVGVYIVAIIAALLGPSFGGTNDQLQGLKWAAYSQTAAWVAGIFNIIPIAGAFLALLGALYGLYLFYLGTAPVMRVPQDKVIGYAVVVILIEIVVSAIIGAVVFAVVAAITVGSAVATGGYR